MITKPMLAGTLENMTAIKYPIGVSPKLDGIRCLIVNGKALTRKFKPVPNISIRMKLEASLQNGLDGEIMIPNADFNTVQSQVMSVDGEPDFEYHVFDYVHDKLDTPYITRFHDMANVLQATSWVKNITFTRVVPMVEVKNEQELLSFETSCLTQGYEGIMLRKLDGPYKCGRSTEREGYLLKLKRFKDAEAIVTGFQEAMENTNKVEKDAFGRTKRSSAKAGLVGKSTLGALCVDFNGAAFAIGTGFTDTSRKQIWDNQADYINKTITFKYQEIGKDLPRFPVFLGFRPECD